MNVKFFTGLVSVVLGLSGCQAPRYRTDMPWVNKSQAQTICKEARIRLKSIREKPLPLVIMKDLMVNTNNSYTAVVYKSEEMGIQDLQKIVMSAATEEAWAYVPVINAWFEMGISEYNIWRNSLNVIKNSLLMDNLIEEYGSVASYHIHPPCFMDGGVLKGMTDAIPSKEDIICAFRDIHSLVRKKGKSGIRFGIVSHYGLTTYSFTGKVFAEVLETKKRLGELDDASDWKDKIDCLAKLASQSKKYLDGFDGREKKGWDIIYKEHRAYLRGAPLDISNTVSHALNELSDESVIFSFQPFEFYD